jgi:hypothetical protein
MTVHGLDQLSELLGIIGAVVVIGVFLFALSVRHKRGVLPGSRGHREGDDTEHEQIRADGYIDSFSRDIEEAGGGLPLVVRLSTVGFFAWFLIYIVLFWSQR